MIKFDQNPANHGNEIARTTAVGNVKTVLTSFIHPKHELSFLERKIGLKSLEEEFSPLYVNVDGPSVPRRTIVGFLLLKQMCSLGDEIIVERYL